MNFTFFHRLLRNCPFPKTPMIHVSKIQSSIFELNPISYLSFILFYAFCISFVDYTWTHLKWIHLFVSVLFWIIEKTTTTTTTVPLHLWNFRQKNSATTNVLGIVMFSVVLGTALGKLGAPGKPLLDFLSATSEAMMIVTHWVIWYEIVLFFPLCVLSSNFSHRIYQSHFWFEHSSNRLSPLGVFFLVVAKIIEMDSLAIIVGKLGAYFCTVMLGLIIHGFGTIAIIFFVCCHKLPYRYISQMGQNLATAFGTGSRYSVKV